MGRNIAELIVMAIFLNRILNTTPPKKIIHAKIVSIFIGFWCFTVPLLHVVLLTIITLHTT